MSRFGTQVKEWFPAAASLCALLLTTAYAVTKESRAAEGIRNADDLASALAETIQTAEQTTRSKEQVAELVQKRRNLEQRLEDSQKPSCVVAELSETARKTGLTVREIQPFNNARAAGPQDQNRGYPQYRIQVHGTYAELAEYMEGCGSQRIPVRVREFRVGRIIGQDSADSGKLTAELIVEVFQPVEPEKPGSKVN